MITEDYVSFETAKLLNDKGFDGVCRTAYETITNEHEVEQCSPSSWGKLNQVKRPTIQMAVKWLRDVHNLIISVEFTIHGWLCDIAKIVRDSSGFIVNINHGVGDEALPYCDEYEKSCETAIKYCLENLI